MTLTCTKCHRTNPQEATYCYFDGMVLPGHGQANGGPLNAGAQPFPREFVFPSGRRCRNFDELALGCVQEWPAAVDLLHHGWLEGFLGGIGRADLAVVAKQASKFPDRDRGLDMLIEKFPSRVVEPPKLQIEPTAINLGQMKVGQSHRFELRITNLGTRLLYGTITIEKGVWIALGDEPGVPEKSFQCDHEFVIPVLIRGKMLKADAKKPLEGKIQIESSGGTAEVLVKVEVPVKPFPDGLLAGARTQRELAERAFKQPKEAAALFESGAVERWYADNGWEYVVQGPTATGLGAVQQFLEACGLTQPPRVQLETSTVKFQGGPGQRLEQTIRVKAMEKKPVFAWAVSDQAWLVPRPAFLKGTTATIPIEIPNVPYGDDTLMAKLTVHSNGRQKFILPVTLEVTPGAEVPEPLMVLPGSPAAQDVIELFDEPEEVLPAGAAPARRADRTTEWWIHALPTLLLLVVLLGILFVDGFRKSDKVEEDEQAGELEGVIDPALYVEVNFPDPNNSYDRSRLRSSALHRFGLILPNENAPVPSKIAGDTTKKKLTYDFKGLTNNTCIRLDGSEHLFGVRDPGRVGSEHKNNPQRPVDEPIKQGSITIPVYKTYWEYPEQKIRVIQEVSIRPNDQTRKLDTMLVRYSIENKDDKPHRVGLRFMLDTFIGANDGVPFAIPGKRDQSLCDTQLVFNSPDEVPDYIEALEREDLRNHGTVARVTLRLGANYETPSKVQLSAWPDTELRKLGIAGAEAQLTRWDVPLANIKTLPVPDSAVIIYWKEEDLAPGKKREMGFAYGLGSVDSEEGGKLGVTAGGSFKVGGEFTVTAYINRPEPGQTVTLKLPDGLNLVDGESEKKDVPPVPRDSSRAQSTVSWRVKSQQTGVYTLTVRLSTGVAKDKKVRIMTGSPYD